MLQFVCYVVKDTVRSVYISNFGKKNVLKFSVLGPSVSTLRGEKPQNRPPLRKINTAACASRSAGSNYTEHVQKRRLCIHRVTVTYFRSIPMPPGFRRHLVGKTEKKLLL